MMKRIFAILLALSLLLSVSAVFADEAAETPAEQAAPVLLLTLNGQEIYDSDDILQYYVSYFLSDEGGYDDDTYKGQAMDNTIKVRLLLQKAAEAFTAEEMEAFREQARKDWNDILEDFLSDAGITEESTEEERSAALADVLADLEANYGYTEEIYVAEGVESEMYSAYYEKLQEEVKASDPSLAEVSDEDIQARYDELVAMEQLYVGDDAGLYEMYQNYYDYEFHYMPKGYRGITHILLKADQDLLDAWTDLSARFEESNEQEEDEALTDGDEDEEEPEEDPDGTDEPEETEEPVESEEPVTAEMVEAARQAIIESLRDKIDDIMARLANGESFEDLIREYGEDPGMEVEENLKNGYPVHPDSLVYAKAFTEGAAALEKVGDYSKDPVVSTFGVHILYYLRDIPDGPLEMSEEVRDALAEEILSSRVDKAVGERLDQMVAEAEIVWTTEGEAWQLSEEEDLDVDIEILPDDEPEATPGPED